MTPEAFDKGMNLLENNFRVSYPTDVRMAIWEWIKGALPNMTDETFHRATTALTGCTFAPKISELKAELIAYKENVTVTPKSAVCEQCKRPFKINEETPEDIRICAECIATNNSDEGRERIKKWKRQVLEDLKVTEDLFKHLGR